MESVVNAGLAVASFTPQGKILGALGKHAMKAFKNVKKATNAVNIAKSKTMNAVNNAKSKGTETQNIAKSKVTDTLNNVKTASTSKNTDLQHSVREVLAKAMIEAGQLLQQKIQAESTTHAVHFGAKARKSKKKELLLVTEQKKNMHLFLLLDGKEV